MMRKLAVPLLIAREIGTVSGKTRMQKIACILEKETAGEFFQPGYKFEIYHHGPFSFELADTLTDLTKKGLLREDSSITPNGHKMYSYWLTPEGETFIESLLEQEDFRKLDRVVDQVVDEHGYLELDELIDDAYSAFEKMEQSG